MNIANYGIHLVVEKSSFELRDLGILDGALVPADRLFSVWLDGAARGQISFYSFERPSIAVHLPFILIWAGTRLFRLHAQTGVLTQLLDYGDELRAVYSLGTDWCVVGEISIAVFDSGFANCRRMLSLDEVVLESWWENGILHLRDLQQRVLRFEFTEDHTIVRG